ncbi:DnaD domain protein [Anaeroselena agilis]|uniref:DnaD domain protein n=1 Tax=Anaeroselena agilis TaxID=3063788 RepID=A0ABU3NYI9_9FIRM|nr:DnaD domain protein [Selenomonadales bacterium 4137-cl]
MREVARKRDIKPGFFKNEDLGELSPLARLFFAGLWCWADRDGRLEDRPRKLKGEILPYDNCDGDELMQQLAEKGFVSRYEVDGNKYIQINNWKKHQSPHPNENGSTIPAPVGDNSVTTNLQVREDSPSSTEVLSEEQRTTRPIPSFTSIPSQCVVSAREQEVVAEVFTFVQNKFGIINDTTREKVLSLIDHYPRDWIIKSLEMAVSAGRRRIGYSEGILQNWRADGYEDYQKPWEEEHRGRGHPQIRRQAKAGHRPGQVDWDAERHTAL